MTDALHDFKTFLADRYSGEQLTKLLQKLEPYQNMDAVKEAYNDQLARFNYAIDTRFDEQTMQQLCPLVCHLQKELVEFDPSLKLPDNVIQQPDVSRKAAVEELQPAK